MRVLLAETQLPGTGNHTSLCVLRRQGLTGACITDHQRDGGREGGSVGMNVNEEVGNERDRLRKTAC